MFAPNRIAVIVTMLAGLLTALAPALANLDTTSTNGLLGGLGAIVAAAVTYLVGWQKHEARQATAETDAASSADALDPADEPPALNVAADVPAGEPTVAPDPPAA